MFGEQRLVWPGDRLRHVRRAIASGSLPCVAGSWSKPLKLVAAETISTASSAFVTRSCVRPAGRAAFCETCSSVSSDVPLCSSHSTFAFAMARRCEPAHVPSPVFVPCHVCAVVLLRVEPAVKSSSPLIRRQAQDDDLRRVADEHLAGVAWSGPVRPGKV